MMRETFAFVLAELCPTSCIFDGDGRTRFSEEGDDAEWRGRARAAHLILIYHLGRQTRPPTALGFWPRFSIVFRDMTARARVVSPRAFRREHNFYPEWAPRRQRALSRLLEWL